MPTGYLVRIVSGPAKGWEYVTFIPPSARILVAPNPGGQKDIGGIEVHGPWMRIPFEGPPWSGERTYVCVDGGPIFGAAPIGDERLTTDGDIIMNYEVHGD